MKLKKLQGPVCLDQERVHFVVADVIRGRERLNMIKRPTHIVDKALALVKVPHALLLLRPQLCQSLLLLRLGTAHGWLAASRDRRLLW